MRSRASEATAGSFRGSPVIASISSTRGIRPNSFGSAPLRTSVGSKSRFFVPAGSPTVPLDRDSARIGWSGDRKPPALSLPDGAPAPNVICGRAMTSSVGCSRWEGSVSTFAHTSPALSGSSKPPDLYSSS